MAREKIKRSNHIAGGMTEGQRYAGLQKNEMFPITGTHTHTDISARELRFTDNTHAWDTHWSVHSMHTPLTACVRVKDKRMASCWWGRIQADYRGEIRSLRQADPVFYLWKTGGCMSQQDGKVCLWTVSECRDGKGPAGMRPCYRNTLCRSWNDANGEWAEWSKAGKFLSYAHTCTNGPRPWLLWHLLVNGEHRDDFFTKVQWYKSNHKSAYFIHQATKEHNILATCDFSTTTSL